MRSSRHRTGTAPDPRRLRPPTPPPNPNPHTTSHTPVNTQMFPHMKNAVSHLFIVKLVQDGPHDRHPRDQHPHVVRVQVIKGGCKGGGRGGRGTRRGVLGTRRRRARCCDWRATASSMRRDGRGSASPSHALPRARAALCRAQRPSHSPRPAGAHTQGHHSRWLPNQGGGGGSSGLPAASSIGGMPSAAAAWAATAARRSADAASASAATAAWQASTAAHSPAGPSEVGGGGEGAREQGRWESAG